MIPRRAQLPLLLTALSVPLATSAAFAHGGDPLPREVLAHPDAEADWVLVTNFGAIYSDDPTHYVCEEAFLGGDDFAYEVFAGGQVLTASKSAVMFSDDGCDFVETFDPAETLPAGLDVQASGSRAALLLNDPERAALWLSEDRGQTWAAVDLDLDEDLRWTGVHFIGEQQLALSAYSRDEATRNQARLFTFDLADDTLTLHDILPNATFPYLYDAQAGRLAGLAGSADGGPLFLFWGTTEQVERRDLLAWPTSIQLAERGSRLTATSITPEGGVLRGSVEADGPASFETIALEHSARCGAQVGETLYLCAQRNREGHDLTRWEDGAGEEALDVKKLEGPRQCARESSVGQACNIVWPQLAQALRIDPGDGPWNELPEPTDMGAPESPMPDMAASPEEMGAAPEPDMDQEGPGDQVDDTTCQMSPARAPATPWAALVMALAVLGGLGRTRPGNDETPDMAK